MSFSYSLMEGEPADTELVSGIPNGVLATIGEEEAPEGTSEDAELLSRAKNLMSKIMSAQDNPNPRHFHALASMLEIHEFRHVCLLLFFFFSHLYLVTIYGCFFFF